MHAGGPQAVTVDAVVRSSTVARSTLYRHFPGRTELVAAAFLHLMPAAPVCTEGSLRERLVATVREQAALLSPPSVPLLAISWLSLERGFPSSRGAKHGDGPEIAALRKRIDALLLDPCDAVLAGADTRVAKSEKPRRPTGLLLLGPVILGSLTRLHDFDYDGAIDSAVNTVLAEHCSGVGHR